jgi:structural maintenance of chromosome 4
MDEIDAALDFKNVSIVGNYIKQRTRNAQFIIISLRNNMFELADRLVGIYKTNDATKSVTINPKLYQNIRPAAAASQSQAHAAENDELADARKPKRSRRSEQKSERGSNDDDDEAEPLRDRTNRR